MSAIEWTDKTWSPLRVRVRTDAGAIAEAKGYSSLVQIATTMQGKSGHHCEHVSPECFNCYAERGNGRCLPSWGTGLPYDRRSRDLVEAYIDEETLMQPLKWKRPRRIFVGSQTDVFGEWYSDEMLDRLFAVMALCPQHVFQVLTKRSKRKWKYFNNEATGGRVDARVRAWFDGGMVGASAGTGYSRRVRSWPLPNLWLGVSAGTQAAADERIPDLLATPAAKRFVSYEPALEAVDFTRIREHLFGESFQEFNALEATDSLNRGRARPALDWIICGGESGPGARPFDIAWARDIIKQCVEAGVACFVKQLGAKPRWSLTNHLGQWAKHVRFVRETSREAPYHWDNIKLKNKKGGEMAEWPEDLRVREMPS